MLVLGLAASLVVFAPGSAHAHHTTGDWKGVTEQGGEVKFRLVRGDRRFIRYFTITLSYECEDGSGETTFDLGSSDTILDGYVEFFHAEADWSIGWSGTFGHDRVAGTAHFQAATWNGLHDCDTGGVGWRAASLWQ
jgi:hypothetical protein